MTPRAHQAAGTLQMNAQHAITGRHIDSRLVERVFAERVVFGDESAVTWTNNENPHEVLTVAMSAPERSS